MASYYHLIILLLLICATTTSLARICPPTWEVGNLPPSGNTMDDELKCFKVFKKQKLTYTEGSRFCEGKSTKNNPKGMLIEVKNLVQAPESLFQGNFDVRVNAIYNEDKGWINSQSELIPDTDFGRPVPRGKNARTLVISKGSFHLAAAAFPVTVVCQVDAQQPPPTTTTVATTVATGTFPSSGNTYLGPNECGTIQSHAEYGVSPYDEGDMGFWYLHHADGSNCKGFTVTFEQSPFDIPNSGNGQGQGSCYLYEDSFIFMGDSTTVKVCGLEAPQPFTIKGFYLSVSFFNVNAIVGLGGKATICSSMC